MGGAQKPDNKPRVSGPGAFARRSDMDGSQPIRAPSGGDYGDRQALENQQQAVSVPEGGPLGEGSSAGPPADLMGLLGGIDTQRPDEDITTGVKSTPTQTFTAQQAADALAEMIADLPEVSSGMLKMYQELRREAMNINQAPSFGEIPAFEGEGPVV